MTRLRTQAFEYLRSTSATSISFNVSTKETWRSGPLPWDSNAAEQQTRAWTDVDDTRATLWLQTAIGILASRASVRASIELLAQRNRFWPEDAPLPAAPARLVRTALDHYEWHLLRCPYCGVSHIHGGGAASGNPLERLGHRSSHCSDRIPGDLGYLLIQTNQRADVKKRKRFSSRYA